MVSKQELHLQRGCHDRFGAQSCRCIDESPWLRSKKKHFSVCELRTWREFEALEIRSGVFNKCCKHDSAHSFHQSTQGRDRLNSLMNGSNYISNTQSRNECRSLYSCYFSVKINAFTNRISPRTIRALKSTHAELAAFDFHAGVQQRSDRIRFSCRGATTERPGTLRQIESSNHQYSIFLRQPFGSLSLIHI